MLRLQCYRLQSVDSGDGGGESRKPGRLAINATKLEENVRKHWLKINRTNT